MDVPSAPKEDSNVFKDDLGEFHHKPAPNKRKEAQEQRLREKISTLKEKRKIETSILRSKTLGESDSDDDARAWIEKNRRIQMEKKKAEERVIMI